MKKKLSKKLNLTKQTVANLNKKEMARSKGGATTTMAGPRCDTIAGACTDISVCGC